MTEEEIKAEAERKTADDLAKKQAFEKAQESLKATSTEDLISIINDVRSEAKDRRFEKKGLEDELGKLKAEQKAKEESQLADDGKLKELIEVKSKELSEKETEITSLKLKADEFTEFKASKIEDAKEKLGDKWNADFANLSLMALDSLVNMMVGKESINTDGGSNGRHSGIELTAEEKKEAKIRYPNLSKERAEEFYRHNLIKQKEREKK